MAYYTEIRFNEPLFINDFNMLMEKAHIESWSTAINSADKDVWKDIKYISSYDQTSIYTESVNAFIKIYGSGVKSDKNNPFLSDYMSSETFNKQRSKNMEVHYRPKTYKTYDWKNDCFFLSSESRISITL